MEREVEVTSLISWRQTANLLLSNPAVAPLLSKTHGAERTLVHVPRTHSTFTSNMSPCLRCNFSHIYKGLKTNKAQLK